MDDELPGAMADIPLLTHKIDQYEKEIIMEHDGQHDRVDVQNIFRPGSGEGGGGASWASILPAMMAERNVSRGWGDGGFGGGLGSGFLGGILGGLLFDRGRGGLFGGNGGDGGAETRIESDIYNTAVLTKLGAIESAIPLASAQTENVILQQTNAVASQINALGLADANNFAQTNAQVAQGFAQTNSAINSTGTMLLQGLNAVNQNVSEQACSVKAVVVEQAERILSAQSARWQLEDSTKINELNARVIELQSEGRRAADNADLRLQITNTNTAVAAQQQGQQQQQQQQILTGINNLFPILQGLVQVAHATNSNVIAGNSGPGTFTTGAQTASPTNVNTR